MINNFINLILILVVLASCNSEDTEFISEGTLTINITEPIADGASLGKNLVVSGECGFENYPITISGDISLQSVCQPGFRWSAPISGDGFSAGQTVSINVVLNNPDYSQTSPVVTRSFVKADLSCDDQANLSKTFANIDDGADGVATPYVICTPNQLANIALYPDKKFELGQNIYFKYSSFNPIAVPFTGELDGKDFRIDDMQINKASDTSVGLFKAVNGATIKNISFNNVSVIGHTRVGVLAGDWRGIGSIENVTVKGSVQGTTMAGGIIGLGNTDSELTITNLTMDVDVTANDFAGGVIAYVLANNTNFTMTNSNIYSNVTGDNYVGGVIGRFWKANANLTNVLHKGNLISNGSYVGGIVGEAYHGVNITDSKHIGSITVNRNSNNGDANVGGLVGVTRGATNITNSYVVTDIVAGGDYVAGLVGRFFGGAIVDSYSRGSMNVNDTYYNGVTKFAGGLVGNINTNSSVQNSHSAMNITAKSEYTGGLVGFVGGATTYIEDSYSTGNISGTKNFIGGLVGQFTGASITGSFSEANLTINDPTPLCYAGGLVGYVNSATATFDMMYSSGDVTVANGTADYIGGGFGYLGASNASNIFTTGNVAGGRNNIGGIAGYLKSPLSFAFASGNISGTLRYIGGLVGISLYQNISDVFFTGTVTGDGEVGGIVGWYLASGTQISNAYGSGNIFKSADSNLGDEIFGPMGGNILGADLVNSYFSDAIVYTDLSTSSSMSSPNNFGTSVVAADLSNQATFSGFDFSADWTMPGGGFNLPFSGSTYSHPIFTWLETPNYGFVVKAVHSDDPQAESDPEVVPSNGSYESLALEFGQNLIDSITSTDPVSTVTQGNLEISILNPPIDNETIIDRMLVYGECGVSGNVIELGGDFNLWTICQSNNRWAAVIDASDLSSGTITLTTDLKNSSLASGSGITTRLLYKPSSVCGTNDAETGVYGNVHLGGDGSATPYVICNRGQLENISLNPGSNFEFGRDVDLGAAPFEPISAEFTGELDGNNFKLKNLFISKTSTIGVGLFQTIGSGASVKNLNLNNVSINGYDQVGALAGKWKGTGYLEDIAVSGNVTGIVNTGGLIGLGNTSSALTLVNTNANLTVTGNNFTGGVIGLINTNDGSFNATNTTLTNTVISGGADGYVGSFIGHVLEPNLLINNISQNGDVQATGMKVGGLIGEMTGGNISNCSVTGNVTITVDGNDGFIGGAIGRSTASASINTCSYAGTIHAGSDNIGGIIGYQKEGVLTNITTSGAINIDDQKYNVPRAYVGGVVGRSEEDLNLSLTLSSSTMDIDAKAKFVGGVAGRIPGDNSVIQNTFATGSIIGNTQFVGGLSGFFMGEVFEDSYATGNVEVRNATPYTYAGGLLGYANSFTSDYKRLYSTGDVTVLNGIADYVGGLIGYFRGGAIEDSYATGDVSGVRNSSGGFIGLHRGTTNRSYSTGNIVSSGKHVGGFIGYLLNTTINDSFSLGNVEANDESGGFIGYINSPVDSVQDIYSFGVVTKASGSSAPDSNFGPVISGEINVGALQTNSSHYLFENRNTNHNSLGSSILTANAANLAEYNGFTFSGDQWRSPEAGYQLPETSVDYTYPVLEWMTGGSGGIAYSVGGTLAGLEHDTLTITLNGSESITLNPGETSFQFGTPFFETDTYSVVITSQPSSPSTNCVLTNGSGTFATSDISDLSISCPTVTGVSLVSVSTDILQGSFDFVQLIANLSDGSTADVTGQTSWGFGTSGVFGINSTGKLSGLTQGSSTLSGTYLGFSDSDTFNCVGAPDAATALVWTESSPHNSATLNANWTKSLATLSSQQINVYQNGNCIGAPVSTVSLGGSVESYIFGSALSNLTYSFKISSINSSGFQALSTCSNNVTVDTSAPNPIFNLSITGEWTNNTTSPLVFWANPSSDVDHVEIALGTSTGASDVISYTDIATASSHTFTGLSISECSAHYPSLKVLDGVGNESTVISQNNIFFKLDTNAPNLGSAPNIGNDALETKSAMATWTAAVENCELSHYEYAIGTSSGGSDVLAWKNIGLVTSYQAEDGIDGVSLTLAQNTDYFTTIRAVDASGQISNEQTSVAWQYFVPENELPEMILWLDGKDTDTIFDSASNSASNGSFNGAVDLWEDKSGSPNQNNFTASSGQPSYNSQNGHLDFNGSNSAMTTADSADINTSTFTEKNISFSIKTSNDINSRQVIYEEGGTVRGMNIYIDNGNLYCGFWNATNDGDGNQGFISVDTPIETNSTYHITWLFDYSNYAGANGPDGLVECFVNNTSIGAQSSTSRLFPHSGDIGIGRMDNDSYFHDGTGSGENYYFNGDFLEVIITNDLPTLSIRNDLYSYLDSKWGSVVSISGNPLAATSVNWQESSPTNSSSLTATWIPSITSDVVKQVVELYDFPTCQGVSLDSQTILNNNETSAVFSSITEGNYYFKVTSFDNDDNSTESACSLVLDVDQSVLVAASNLNWSEGNIINSAAITASWTKSPDGDIASQEVRVFANNVCTGSAISNLTTSGNSESISLSGTNGNDYYYNITTIDTAGNELVSNCSSLITVDLVAPNTALGLVWAESSPHDSSSITATWTKSTSMDLDSQKIDLYNQSNCTGVVASTITVDDSLESRVLNGTPGSNHYFRVTSIDIAGNTSVSACSAGLYINTQAIAAPTAPSWSEVDYSNNLNVTMSWGLSSEPSTDSQRVDVYQNGNCSATAVASYPLGNAITSQSFSGVNGNTYSFSVTVIKGASESTSICSSGLIFDTDAPSDASGVNVSPNWISGSLPISSPVFTWTNPSSDISSVEVSLGTSQNSSDIVSWQDEGLINQYSFSNLNLTECIDYYPNVRIKDPAGNLSGSVSSSVGFKYDDTLPVLSGSISLTTTLSSTTESPEASWNVGSDNCSFSHYEVSISSTTDESGILAGAYWVNVGNLNSGSLSSLNLDIGSTYYTLVRASDSSGQVSAYLVSPAWTVVEAADQITFLESASIYSDSISLYWHTPNDNGSSIVDYIIEYKESSSGTWLTFNDGVSIDNRVTIDSLIPNTDYDFKVSANNGVTSIASNILSQKTSLAIDFFDATKYMAINITGATSSKVVALEDNTQVTLNGSVLTTLVNAGDTFGFTSTQFDEISADKPIFTAGRVGSGGATVKSNTVWSTPDLAGKNFVAIFSRNATHNIEIYALEASNVEVYRNGSLVGSQAVTANSLYTFSNATNGSYEVNSDGLILVNQLSVQGGSSYTDVMPVFPGSGDVIGIPSQTGQVAAAINGASYSINHSDGTSSTDSLALGNFDSITGLGTRSAYQAEALRLQSSDLITAKSSADGNGNDSAPFIPLSLMKEKFATNVNATWVAFTSDKPVTINVINNSDVIVQTLTLTRSGSGDSPYKGRLTSNISEGMRFESSTGDRFGAWYEPSSDNFGSSQDETILLGY